MAWAIIDTKTDSLYIHRTWPKQSQAEWERAELLYGFTQENEWHSRLKVVPWENPSGVQMKKSGYRREP